MVDQDNDHDQFKSGDDGEEVVGASLGDEANQTSSAEPEAQGDENDGGQKAAEAEGKKDNHLLAFLAGALVITLLALGFLIVILARGEQTGSGSGPTAQPPVVSTSSPDGETLPPGVVPTVDPADRPTVIPPQPEEGEPTATVTAPGGVNVRTGPGTNYSTIGAAPFGAEMEIVGVSSDGLWWVVAIPGAPNNQGWVASQFVAVENEEGVPVIPTPATPTPMPTATPTAVPAPDIVFTADRSTISAGETTTLRWAVENVQAVYVYPIGTNYQRFPVPGIGSRQVQPFVDTIYEMRVVRNDDALELRQQPIQVRDSLTTGRWLLQSLNIGSDGLTSVIPGTELTASFTSDGGVSGQGGCNTYNSTYTAFEDVLRFGAIASTGTLCDENVSNQESQFFGNLQLAEKFTIFSNQLTIRDGAGRTLLIFNR